MRVLLSIKPEFANKILSGEKKYEFRKVIHTDRSVGAAYIYATSPIQRIIGEFEIIDILTGSAENIWELTSNYSGIDYERYMTYFAKKQSASAIKIGKVKKFDPAIHPKDLIEDFTPPQSFMYVPKKIQLQKCIAGGQLKLI